MHAIWREMSLHFVRYMRSRGLPAVFLMRHVRSILFPIKMGNIMYLIKRVLNSEENSLLLNWQI